MFGSLDHVYKLVVCGFRIGGQTVGKVLLYFSSHRKYACLSGKDVYFTHELKTVLHPKVPYKETIKSELLYYVFLL